MPARVVACQGPIQLVTALAVLRQRDSVATKAWDDHLIILELAAPASQEKDFVDALKGMARTLRPWKSIVHWQDTDSSTLQGALADRGWLESSFGIATEDVREVLVVREWQPSNQALLAAFPSAVKICFGDSIGIYLAPSFMAPTRRWRRRALDLFRPLSRMGRVSDPVRRSGVAADCYYLALPDAFDVVPGSDVRLIDIRLLRSVVSDLRAMLPPTLVTALKERMRGRKLVVLVGSNFSEQGTIGLNDELQAYLDYLGSQGLARKSLVLLKPHPRDRMEKIEKLECSLRQMFDDVFTLSDSLGFYLPLEALLLELLEEKGAREEVEVCTFSSACLASMLILQIRPRIGFGDTLVDRHFKRQFKASRKAHERQLLKACNQSPQPEMTVK